MYGTLQILLGNPLMDVTVLCLRSAKATGHAMLKAAVPEEPVKGKKKKRPGGGRVLPSAKQTWNLKRGPL